MRRAGAFLVLALPLAGLTQALADGIVTPQYRYVSPPKFLRATNLRPHSGSATLALTQRGPSLTVATKDPQPQVTIRFAHGAFGNPAGQRAVSIGITPLRRFPPLPGNFALDGNVYGLRFAFVPSGTTISQALGSVLIYMLGPHTPAEMYGLFHGSWRLVCQRTKFIYSLTTGSCYTYQLPSEVALVHQRSNPPRRGRRKGGAFPASLVVGIGVAIAAVGLAALYLTRAPRRRVPRQARRQSSRRRRR